MSKTPYEIVAVEANKLLTKMLTAPDVDTMKKYHDQYLAYLDANGWSDYAFDKATLEQVNESWEDPLEVKPINKKQPRQFLN